MFVGLISFALSLLLAMTAMMLSTCASSPYNDPPPNPKDVVKPYIRGQAQTGRNQQNSAGKSGRDESSGKSSVDGTGYWWVPDYRILKWDLWETAEEEKTQPVRAPANKGASGEAPSLGCFAKLSGTWRHPNPAKGIWEFEGGNRATITQNSTNYGSAAKRITEFSLISCSDRSMSYKVVRAALINTVDPSMAYDKTPANAPTAPNWSKIYNQPYSIVGNTLKFGDLAYTKVQ